jgi:hypothetical protein
MRVNERLRQGLLEGRLFKRCRGPVLEEVADISLVTSSLGSFAHHGKD